MKISRPRNAGFTLIELMIVVAIIGILSMLAMTGYKGYMASAKASEAKASLGSIGKLALASYERETGGSTTILTAAGASTAANGKTFCDSETAFVPTAPPNGVKYQSTDAMWRATANAGFGCLGFTMQGAQYFAYGYKALNTTALAATAGPTFAAYAVGDLNGNAGTGAIGLTATTAVATGSGAGANYSTYAINGGATQNTGATIAPAMIEINPTE